MNEVWTFFFISVLSNSLADKKVPPPRTDHSTFGKCQVDLKSKATRLVPRGPMLRPPRGFWEVGKRAICFQEAGEHW